jgi:hypothetical protein
MDDQSGRFEFINLEYLEKHVNSENLKDPTYCRTSIHWAAHQNKPECMHYLLGLCGDISLRDHLGWQAIYLSAVYNHLECMKLLLDYGANIEDSGSLITTNTRYTPLYGAICNNRFKTAYMLIDRGANINNVSIDRTRLKSIPNWVVRYIEHRKSYRYSVIVVLGLQKFRMSRTFQSNGRDAIRLIGKHIWSMRMLRMFNSEAL